MLLPARQQYGQLMSSRRALSHQTHPGSGLSSSSLALLSWLHSRWQGIQCRSLQIWNMRAHIYINVRCIMFMCILRCVSFAYVVLNKHRCCICLYLCRLGHPCLWAPCPISHAPPWWRSRSPYRRMFLKPSVLAPAARWLGQTVRATASQCYVHSQEGRNRCRL